jgi:hypothetical protein
MRSIWIIVAGVAVLVPLTWAVINFAGDDEKSASNPPESPGTLSGPNDNGNSQQPDQPEEPAKEFKLDLVEQAPNLNRYRISGVDQVEIAIKGTGGDSWVQIRDNFDFDDEKKYLEDRTVTKGYEWAYDYQFDNSPDLVIRLGEPQNVIIKVNGKLINTAKVVHIKKSDEASP